MSESVRKVTELEIRRLLLGFDRSELAVRLELCCDEGGGINAQTLRRWRLAVGSVAELGIGDTFESARWWTWMTEDEWIEEVNRRKALEVLGSAGLLLPAQADRRRVAAGGPFPRRRGGPVTATRVATDIAGAYADTPDGQVIRSAKAHVYTLLDLLDRASMTGAARTRLEAVASDAACLAGYGELRRGQLVEADG